MKKQTKTTTKSRPATDKPNSPACPKWAGSTLEAFKSNIDLEKLSDVERSILAGQCVKFTVGVLGMSGMLLTSDTMRHVRRVARFTSMSHLTAETPVAGFIIRLVDRYHDEQLTPDMIYQDLQNLWEDFRKASDAATTFKKAYPTQR